MPHTVLTASYHLTDKVFVFGNVAFEGLDSAIANSPVVRSNNTPVAFVGAAYLFGDQKKFADASVPTYNQDPRRWAYRVHYGYQLFHNIFPLPMAGYWPKSERTPEVTPTQLGITFSRLIQPGDRVDFYARLGLFNHFEEPAQEDFWSYNAYMTAMIKTYSRVTGDVALRWGVSFGVSYADRIPMEEIQKVRQARQELVAPAQLSRMVRRLPAQPSPEAQRLGQTLVISARSSHTVPASSARPTCSATSPAAPTGAAFPWSACDENCNPGTGTGVCISGIRGMATERGRTGRSRSRRRPSCKHFMTMRRRWRRSGSTGQLAMPCFPKYKRGALIFGWASGVGVVIEGDESIGTVKARRFSHGAQIGYKSQAQVIVFKTQAALDAFKRGHIEFTPAASSAAGSADTATEGGFKPRRRDFQFLRQGPDGRSVRRCIALPLQALPAAHNGIAACCSAASGNM